MEHSLPKPLPPGPLALIFAEDAVEIDSTIRHHLQAGFRSVLLFAPEGIGPLEEHGAQLRCIGWDPFAPEALSRAVNRVIAALPAGEWVYYGYNAEYLVHPFCESRSLREMLCFHMEERRAAMLTYVIDLYAPDLQRNPDAVNLAEAMFDRAGYFALARNDAQGAPRERQLDFHGGLRWRFEEHVAPEQRRIDRISLFRTAPGLRLRLRPDHTLSIEEYNTYACPWHNNLTAAICSFRTAKALRTNPGSRHAIPTFRWPNSVKFDWHSQQLMDLGLMEPGQWF